MYPIDRIGRDQSPDLFVARGDGARAPRSTGIAVGFRKGFDAPWSRRDEQHFEPVGTDVREGSSEQPNQA
jgi:hypothetical protein